MADIATDIDGKVASDGARKGNQGVGSAKEDSSLLDGVLALPDHGNDGARRHVLNEASEEGLADKVRIVPLEVFLGGMDHLEANELVASSLESLQASVLDQY